MDAELISHLGNDLTVVNAARVSFDKESEWESITPAGPVENVLKDKDVKLIKYLAKHNHFTPFTHCMITLRETVPIFVARQRFKHTIGFSYNEVSRRYVNDTPEFYTPDTWRFKADNVKQGSHYTGLTSQEVNGKLRDKEEANGLIMSMVLPQSMYTSYYVTGSLAAFARAYKLRSDDLAQIEIQNLAERWNNIIEELYPVSWEALTK
jgi:thymidylate synthase (FAD)